MNNHDVPHQWPELPATPLPPDIAGLPTIEARPWVQVGPGGEFPTLEGPVFDREGNFYVCHTIQPETEILKITPAGEITKFYACGDAMPVGLAIHRDGRIFGADLHGSLLILTPEGELERRIPAVYQGEQLVSDDLAFDRNGDLYFTDFRGSHIDPIGGVYVMRAETGYTEIELVTKGISAANGISFSPDYSVLWIGETGRNTVIRLGKGRDGTFRPGGVNTKVVYTAMGVPMADSNKVDGAGNLYQAMMWGGRILVLNSEGVPIGNVLVPERDKGKHLANMGGTGNMSDEMKKLVTYVWNGVELASEAPGCETIFTEPLDIAHSCKLDKDKPLNWRAGLYVTEKGVIAEKSVSAAIAGGEIGQEAADGIAVESHSDDFSALIADGGRYTLKNAKINMPTHSDGKNVCDFAGLGSAVAAFNAARVEIVDSEIETEGVAKCMVYADNAADVVIRRCRMEAKGGRPYDGYVNSADFNFMVASPWVLGMTGNARGTNIMGDKTSMVLADSDVKARNWGVLSTDNGEGNILAVIDSTLTVTGGEEDKKNPYHKSYGSGYGTYILGCNEDFRGVTINAGTYVGIARDGNAVYRSSRGPIRILSARSGEVLYEAEGKGNISRLHSDAFGIMAHGNAELTLTDGTVMDTENASFLLRSGGVHIRVEDGAKLAPKDGVLLQIIDDDDMTVGVDFHGKVGLQFKTEFFEKAGWPSENGQVSSRMPPPDPSDRPPPPPMPEGEEPPEPPRFDASFTAADVELSGDIYNGSGYYGQKAKELTVSLEKGAVLTGCISATETIHVDENGAQNTHFTSEEYYYLGRVANRPYYHGDNTVEVTLEAGSVWNVRGEGVISSLSVKDGAVLNGILLLDGAIIVPEAGKTYTGSIIVRG